MASEDQLIARIGKSLPSIAGGRNPAARLNGLRVRLGIGDDAAILSPGGKSDWILTCDAFIEGVHFLRDMHPSDSVGYKALARATSDIAAMGGAPRAFLLTLALPQDCVSRWLDQFLAGMKRAARKLDLRLIGGDTTRTPQIFISITVLGEVARGLAVKRSGARPGDLIYVSGRLGRAQLGLELLRGGIVSAKRVRIANAASSRNPSGALISSAALLQPHLYPEIRVELGAWLAQHRIASAMMDISDGLSIDLARLCNASGAGAKLDARRIPCVQIPERVARRLSPAAANTPDIALQMALHGGEDYELLFTVSRRNVSRLRQAPAFSQLTAIGEITRERKILLVDEAGQARALQPGGWDPFRARKE
ncbi:MAG TPA: thiamine-phosphate kinase [Candidatus Dormibacteraeota bacterium]|nr:thiamine-phosphate kinase [Candidatus Dormibacteraeota bacterium]